MVGQVLCTVSERDSSSLCALTTPNISSLAPSLACVSLQLLALLLSLRSLSSFDGGLALALPRSRFCVERRKEGGLSARLAEVEDDWFLAPLATRCTALVLHSSSSSSTLPAPLHQSAASRAKTQHLGITKSDAEAGKTVVHSRI